MAVEPDIGGMDPRVASLVREGMPVRQAVQVVADADRARVTAESQEGAARAGRKSDRRDARRAAVVGVDPESIPFNYQTGEPIGTPAQYNQPEAVADAELEARQTWADEETRGLRDGSVRTPGSRAWNAEGLQMGGQFRSPDEQGLREEFLNRFGREIRDDQIDGFRRQIANERAAQLDADLRDRGLGHRRVPAPNTGGGLRPRQGEAFDSVGEAEAYYTRPEIAPGRYGPSQADRDMAERGFVPVVTPDGVRYKLASEGAPGNMPGGNGRRGYREDLVRPTKRTATNPDMIPMWEEGEGVSPSGQGVHVLVPTAANRIYNANMERERRLIRQATAANMPIMEFAQRSGAYDELLSDDDTVARLMAAEGRRKQQQSQADAWRAQTMLAGGQTTPRSRAAVNAMMGADADTQNQIRAYWASGGQGATPLEVQAAEGKRAAELAARTVQGALAGGAAEQAVQDKIAQEKYNRAKTDFNDWLNRRGGPRGYTPAMRDQAKRWLSRLHPDLPMDTIEAIVDMYDANGGRPDAAMPDPTDPLNPGAAVGPS